MREIYQSWCYDTQIVAAAFVTVSPGRNGTSAGSLFDWVDVEGLDKLTWYYYADQPVRLIVDGAKSAFDFAAGYIMETQLGIAATPITPYLLAAPRNQTGFVTLTMPKIRIRLENTGVADTTTMTFYAKAWK